MKASVANSAFLRMQVRWREFGSVALLAGLTLYAHRGLLVDDPYALTAVGRSETGEIFFAPEAGAPGVILALFGLAIAIRLARCHASAPGRGLAIATTGLLLVGCALCAWGTLTSAPFVLAFSLGAVTLGLGGWLYGAAGIRALGATALFPLLAAPWPVNLMNQVIHPLQLGTTRAAALLLSAGGFDATVTGDVIRVAGRTVEVIESCSGLRGMTSLCVAALFYVVVFPRRGRHDLLLVAAAPLLAFAVNAVRVASLALNPESDIAAVHLTQGLLVFGAGCLGLAGLDRLLVRLSPPIDTAKSRHRISSATSSDTATATRWGIATASLALLALATSRIVPFEPAPRPDWRMFEIPTQIGRWRASPLALDLVFFGTARFSDSLQRRYVHPNGDVVDLLAVSDDRALPHTGLLSPKLVLPIRGWEQVSRRAAGYSFGGRPVTLFEIQREDERALVALVSIGIGPLPVELARSALSLDRSPFQRDGRAVVLRATATVSANLRSLIRAEADTRRFLMRLAREIDALDARYAAIRGSRNAHPQ